MTRILQILPRVPPTVCGIGDYAWLLARELREAHGIHSGFLCAGTHATLPEGETEFPVFRLPELSAQALETFVTARAGEFDAVVLHMSPYGYQKRGVPLWLASGWRRLSERPTRPHLLTMFHELFATGSFRTSAFWLQPLQKHVLHVVAQASDAVRTNRAAYADWLVTGAGCKKQEVVVMPVFSNVGEPSSVPGLATRSPAMVYFASGVHGGQDAGASLRECGQLAGKLGATDLHLIGGPALERHLPQLKITPHGYLPTSELSTLLLQCRYGFSAYHPAYLAKSGIWAGFAAHGLAVFLAAKSDVLPDDLRHGTEFLRLDRSLTNNLSSDALDAAARGLREWYGAHSLRETALSYSLQVAKLMKR